MNTLCPWGRKIYSFITPRGVSRYQYAHLDDELKPVYLELEKAIMSETQTEVSVKGRHSTEAISWVFHALQLDNPWVFDVTGLRLRQILDRTVIDFIHNLSPGERRDRSSRMRMAAENIAAELSGKSDYEKELYIHDRLVRTVKYDLGAKNAFNALGPLLDGSAVCQDISIAASFLLNWCGVDAGVLTGKVDEIPDAGHAWNIVWLGEEYHLDVTFDLQRSLFGGVVHRYFNLSDELMSKHRTWRTETHCRSMENNYYSVSGSVLYTEDSLPAFLERNLATDTRQIEFRASQKICGKLDNRSVMEVLGNLQRRHHLHMRYRVDYCPQTGCCYMLLER